MAKYYAWSKIPTKIDEWGTVRESVMPGDEVTQAKLGVEKEEWESLIEAGAVSEEEYPDIPDDMSPAEYYRQEAAKEALVAEVEELTMTPEQPAPTPAPSTSAKAEK